VCSSDLVKRGNLGRVAVYTERSIVQLDEAKETLAGIEGVPDENGPSLVPRSEIRGVMVYEPKVRPLSAGAIAGITVGAIVGVSLAAAFAGLSCGLKGLSNWGAW